MSIKLQKDTEKSIAHHKTATSVGARFDGAFFSCRLEWQKPDHGFYSAGAREIGCLPAEILLIDDSSANVVGAKAPGWNAVHFRIVDDLGSLTQSLETGHHMV